jgi:hypothetical protein
MGAGSIVASIFYLHDQVKYMNRRTNKRRNNKGIATWLKWLLGLMAVAFVLCLATCGLGGFFVYQAFQDGTDPVKAEKVANTIVQIKQLPPNYKYSFGMDMMVMTMVVVTNSSNKMTYMLFKVPTSTAQGANQPKSADEFVEQMAAQGVPTAGGSGSKTTITVKEKGKTKVGNTEMPYIIGVSQSSSGKQQPAFLGCVMPTKDEAILVCAATEDESKPIDMTEVNGFLSNIESFK